MGTPDGKTLLSPVIIMGYLRGLPRPLLIFVAGGVKPTIISNFFLKGADEVDAGVSETLWVDVMASTCRLSVLVPISAIC